MYRHSLLLALGITAFVMSPFGVAGTRTESARATAATLKKVTSSLDPRTGLLTIEASAPVPYVASQVDARTTLVEMRDVVVDKAAARVRIDRRHPIDAVNVESAVGRDGASIARVRITFHQPIRPRIRSSRNVILIEADRVEADRVAASPALGAGATVGPTPGAATFAPTISDVRIMQRGTATAVTLYGTAPLVASSLQEPKEGPRRLILNLPDANSAVASTSALRGGPVNALRIAMSPSAPYGTQVTMELSRAASYRLEPSATGNELSVVFDEQTPDPIAALLAPAAAAARIDTSRPAFAAAQAAAPPAPQQPEPAAPADAPQRQFTGAPLSIDFDGADLQAVLRTLAREGGINIYIDPRVQGTVTTSLVDIPWDEAFDLIATSNGVGYVQSGSVVRVAPLAVLSAEEAEKRKLAEEKALSGELVTETKALSYAAAKDLQVLIEDTILSQRGQVRVDERTNTMIITDLADRVQRGLSLLDTLDKPQPQVEIEARIVQTSRDFARQIGVDWGLNGRVAPELGNTSPLAFPNQGSVSGRIGAIQGPDDTATGVNLGLTNPSSAIGLALGSVNGSFNLDVALSALERSGKGRILSTPRISTENNKEAEIMQGVQIPIQTVANNTVTVTWKDAALILRVLPQITTAGTVIMRIVVENGSPDFVRAIEGNPPINTQRANTQVRVADGNTTVIGGIFLNTEQTTQSRVPALGKLPVVGFLFRRDEVTDESRELLIFITPRIIT